MVQMAYEMIRLAKKVANQTEFQQEKQYKIFKAKQNDHHRQLKHLADELFSLSFHEECVYWLHKVFEELRISDKKERHSVLKTLCFSYFNLKKYEKAIEYGQKSLDIGLKIPLSHTINTLVAMRISASNLKRYQDASSFRCCEARSRSLSSSTASLFRKAIKMRRGKITLIEMAGLRRWWPRSMD